MVLFDSNDVESQFEAFEGKKSRANEPLARVTTIYLSGFGKTRLGLTNGVKRQSLIH
jgi:hypothetical protein